jgi:hypothetical protein
MIKDLKVEILICFKSPITKHWTLLHQTPHIFPILSPNWKIFIVLKMVGDNYYYYLSFQNQNEDFISFEFLNVHSPAYLSYQTSHSSFTIM